MAAPIGVLDALWSPGAKHHPGAALVGLELVEDRLDLPPFGIQPGEFVGGAAVGFRIAVSSG